MSSSSGSETLSGSPVGDADDVKENDPTPFCPPKDEIDHSSALFTAVGVGKIIAEPAISGLFLYIDFHGHASKKGKQQKLQ